MAQYQVRVWRGRHHHMALVCLAQLFSEKTRNTYQESHPLLSARDITELLDYYLPRKKRNENEVLCKSPSDTASDSSILIEGETTQQAFQKSN